MYDCWAEVKADFQVVEEEGQAGRLIEVLGPS